MNKKKLREIRANIMGGTEKEMSDSFNDAESILFDAQKSVDILKSKYESFKDKRTTFAREMKDLSDNTEKSIKKIEKSMQESVDDISDNLIIISDTVDALEQSLTELYEDTALEDSMKEIRKEYALSIDSIRDKFKEATQGYIKESDKKSAELFKDISKRILSLSNGIKENKEDAREARKQISSLLKLVDKIVIDLDKFSKQQYEYGSQLQILSDGEFVGQSNQINFIGASVSASQQGGINVTIPGGSGLTELEATGSVDSVNTMFVFVSKPKYIVSDGAWYKENIGWTWDESSLTATMEIAPNDAIWGF